MNNRIIDIEKKYQRQKIQECIQGDWINKGRVPTTYESLLSQKS